MLESKEVVHPVVAHYIISEQIQSIDHLFVKMQDVFGVSLGSQYTFDILVYALTKEFEPSHSYTIIFNNSACLFQMCQNSYGEQLLKSMVAAFHRVQRYWDYEDSSAKITFDYL